jgi:hypothetical protein
VESAISGYAPGLRTAVAPDGAMILVRGDWPFFATRLDALSGKEACEHGELGPALPDWELTLWKNALY